MTAQRERRDRATMAAEARRLSDAGNSTLAIAEALGISRSYAYALLHDPTGQADRERKRRYAGTCAGCGAPTTGSDGRDKAPAYCYPCHAARSRVWTVERMIDAYQRWTAEHGRQPSADDWRTAGAGAYWPSSTTVQRELGAWNALAAAAGLPPRKGYEDLDERRRRLHEQGLTVKEIAKREGRTAKTIRAWLLERGLVEPMHCGFAPKPSGDPWGIRAERVAAGLSQTELGRLAGIDQSVVSRAEHGSPRATAADVERLLRAARAARNGHAH